jgi:hypothetical protein
MLTRILIITAFLLPSFLLIAQEDKKPNGFIGVDACTACHKTEKQGKQLDIWKESKHSKAFLTLQTDKANQIAKDLGHSTPAAETEACLKCHASGLNFDASLLGPKFKMSDGVQCETCHGAGSNYKSAKVMKNREEAIANGLVVHEKLDDFCVSCHNPESPTFVEINIQEAWKKIMHPVPESK